MSQLTYIFILILWGGVLLGQSDLKPRPIQLKYAQRGGFFDEAVVLELSSVDGANIYFTIDGSAPSSKKNLYKKPLLLKKTTIVRAIAILGEEKSKMKGETYFINEPTTDLAVISLSIDPWRLFDPDYGLFMEGKNPIDSIWSKPGANFWSRREYPMHCEIYEANGKCVFNSGAGFRLFGGFSRLFPQKSMTIVARDRYGKKRIRHEIFGEEGEEKFKFLVLRNSGSDFGKTHFRDGLMTSLLEDWDIEKQDYRPSHVYINGDYWGIYNIREKINRYFLSDYHDVHKDSIDLMEHQAIVKMGDDNHYNAMLHFLRRNPLTVPSNYEYIESQMEVDNFMDYQIAQIYFDNQDAGGNIKFWRPRTSNGRWRWIMFDTDWGFGLHDYYAASNNSLEFHTKPNGTAWPNPAWTTFILRKLLENQAFEQKFINRFADHLNVSFHEDVVTQKIANTQRILLPEIDRQLQRWNLDRKKWERQVKLLYDFAEERPDAVRMHLMDKFNTGAQVGIQLNSSKGGKVLLNDNLEIKDVFRGIYFEHIPIKAAAIPDYGYRFSHWEGLNLPQEGELEDNPSVLELHLDQQKVDLKAVFEAYVHPLAGQIIINEVSANNKKSGDWIELFNRTEESVSLVDWVFTDRKNEFRLPNIKIAPNDYIVLCEDSAKFFQVFPNAYNVVGGLNFGINKHKERLQLFTPEGAMVDSLSYELLPTDSVYTLSLLLPRLDNGDLENWNLRKGIGTPNAGNPYYIESKVRREQELWLQVGMALSTILVCILLLIVRHRQDKFFRVSKN
ncbi:MAG: CotH kinase family protein [Bacteroidota bacterium]